MSDFFDNPDKTGNLKFRWLVFLFSSGEDPKEKKDGLNQATGASRFVKKILIGRDVKYYHSKAKFLGGVQIYPQGLIRIMVAKSRKLGQGVLYGLEKGQLLRG